jgi:hypothetical protein
MGNGRLYSTIGSYLAPNRSIAPIAASKIGPLYSRGDYSVTMNQFRMARFQQHFY